MKALTRTLHLSAAVTLVTALAALAAPVARAQTYPDVPKGMWARAAIDWATDQGPAGNKLLDDYDGVAFKPDRAITRAQLARALVIASGHAGDVLADPIVLADTPPQHPYYTDVELAVKLHLLGTYARRVPPRCPGDHDAGEPRDRQDAAPAQRGPRLDHAGGPRARELGAQPGLEDRRPLLPALRGRGALPEPALQPSRRAPTPRRSRPSSRSAATRSPTASTRRPI